MPSLVNLDTGEEITRYVNFKDNQEVNKVVQKSLDGKEYISRFGSPTIHYELTLYVDDDGKRLLQEAEDTVALLYITVNKGNYSGRIIELSDFDQLLIGWYKVTATLSPNSEV